MTSEPLIAVLLTCFNRKAMTLRLLERLHRQQDLNAELCIFVVDDGCTDGTAEAIRQLYPHVHIIAGTGQLYWCGGMRLAQHCCQQLLPRSADYQLWLNDDVDLDDDAIARLLAQTQSLQAMHQVGAVVGAVRDQKGLSYGGRVRRSRWWPLRMSQVLDESAQPQVCDFINGNVCLLPAAAIQAAGELSADYTHSMGDFDYGLRLRQLGFSLWQAAGSYGHCKGRPVAGSIRDRSLPLQTRLALLDRPNQAAPVQQWQKFVRQHGGLFWPLLWLKAQCRTWWPAFYLRLIAKAPEHKVVVVVQQVLRQYRLAFWQQLQHELAAQQVQLLVLFGQPDSFEAQKRDTISSPPTPWFVPCDVKEFGPFVWQHHACLASADLVICEHASRHLLPFWLRMRGKKLAWWGHGYDHQAPIQGVRAWWKRQLIGIACHYFAYTEPVATYLHALGMASSDTTVVYNSQDCRDVAAACQQRHAPSGPLTALYCGSLYQEKRVDLLVQAAKLALSRGLIARLIIVGDGPLRPYVEQQLTVGIEFTGALFGQAKAEQFARADVVLNPGMTGLAILDAFNAGLPYITCSDSVHSPEIDYLQDGVNGFMVQGDADSICQALEQLRQGTVWRQLSLGALSAARRYQLPTMVHQFQQGVCHVLGLRRYQVCIVHQAYRERGGEDIVVQRELQWLRAQGIDVCLHQTTWPRSTLVRQLQFLWRLLRPKSTQGLPDAAIYWLHNTQSSYGLQAVRVLSRRGKVWQTLHNVRPLWPAGVFAQDQWFGPTLASIATAWRKHPYHGSRIVSALMAWRNWRSADWYQAAQRLYCPSEYLRQQYLRAGYPASLLELKPHFCQAATAAQQPRQAGVLRLLFVGRDDPSKGLPWVLEQWSQLQQICVDHGVRCLLTIASAQQSSIHLPLDVQATSAESWADMSALYQQADLVLMPSLVAESFGNVVIEAAAHGLPVLGSDAGALATLVPQCLGYKFKTGDPQDFQRQFNVALAEVLDEHSQKFAQRRAVWLQYFSAAAHAQSVLADLRDYTAP